MFKHKSVIWCDLNLRRKKRGKLKGEKSKKKKIYIQIYIFWPLFIELVVSNYLFKMSVYRTTEKEASNSKLRKQLKKAPAKFTIRNPSRLNTIVVTPLASTASTIVSYFSLWAKLSLLDTSHCCSFVENLSRSDQMKALLSQKMNRKVIESVLSSGSVCAANEHRTYAWNRTRYAMGNYPSLIIAQQKSVLLLLFLFLRNMDYGWYESNVTGGHLPFLYLFLQGVQVKLFQKVLLLKSHPNQPRMTGTNEGRLTFKLRDPVV